jgi:hypothetical protein
MMSKKTLRKAKKTNRTVENKMLGIKEYRTVANISGPLMLVEKVDGAKFGHIVDIELGDGSIRHGQILQVEKDKVLVQVFEGTHGVDVDRSAETRLIYNSAGSHRLSALLANRLQCRHLNSAFLTSSLYFSGSLKCSPCETI